MPNGQEEHVMLKNADGTYSPNPLFESFFYSLRGYLDPAGAGAVGWGHYYGPGGTGPKTHNHQPVPGASMPAFPWDKFYTSGNKDANTHDQQALANEAVPTYFLLAFAKLQVDVDKTPYLGTGKDPLTADSFKNIFGDPSADSSLSALKTLYDDMNASVIQAGYGTYANFLQEAMLYGRYKDGSKVSRISETSGITSYLSFVWSFGRMINT